MNFRKWLFEVGVSGGVGSGINPAIDSPTQYQGAFADYHGEEDKDPRNPNGKLPPVLKKNTKLNYKKNHKYRS